ncbi:MAG: hypothetical protein HY885_13990 [Deltaproteobacteria bacterium]|nr:hypothetical protein [Deltaproteobacteria bacterium]
MKNKLFTEAPKGWGIDNAIVGGRWASRYAYINGYYLAASVLAETALRGQPRDLLFYPICFNYRHCIELHLKALIIEARNLHDVLTKLDEPVKELPALPKKIMSSHSLKELLQCVENLLSLFSEEKMNAAAKKTIRDLDIIDFNSQAFRYDSRLNGTPTLPKASWVDLRNIIEKMKEAHFHLIGIAMWMADQGKRGR